MADANAWDVFCVDEDHFILNVYSANAPTVCPNNPAHAIRTVRLSNRIGDAIVAEPTLSTSVDLIPRNNVDAVNNACRIYCTNSKLYMKNTLGNIVLLSNDRDHQMSSSNVPAASAAIRFTEIPNMIITTSNISARNYKVMFNATVGVKNGNNIDMDFIISVNDVDALDSQRTITIDSTLTKRIVHMVYVTAPLANNSTIKVKWRGFNSTRTKEMYERLLIAEGDAADSNATRNITLDN